MNKTVITAAIVSILFLIPDHVQGYQCPVNKPYWEDRHRGWFYFEDCSPKQKPEDKKETKENKEYKLLPSTEVKIPWDVVDKLDPDEIVKIELESRKIAVMYPTDSNVKEYRRFLAWTIEKASAYTDADVKLHRTDPEFAMSAVSQGSTYAKDILLSYRKKEQDDILAEYKDKAAIVVMVKKGCIYCEGQMPILGNFKDQFGWDTPVYDIEERPAMAERLGVKQTPDLFLVLKKDNELVWQRIGAGLHTLPELKDAVMYGLYILGEVKDEKLISK